MANKVILTGRLKGLPAMKYYEKDGKVIAVLKMEITIQNGDGTDDHEIICFGEEAERIAGLDLQPGSAVLIDGRVKSKIIKKEGAQQKIVEIRASHIEPL